MSTNHIGWLIGNMQITAERIMLRYQARFNKSELKVHDVNDNPLVEANIIAIKEKI